MPTTSCPICGKPRKVLLYDRHLNPLLEDCQDCEPSVGPEPLISDAELEGYSEWCRDILRRKTAWTVLPPRLDEYLEYEAIVKGFSLDRDSLSVPIEEDEVTYGLLLVWIAQTLGQQKRKAIGLRCPPVLTETGQWLFPGGSLVLAAQRVAMELALVKRWTGATKDVLERRLKSLTEQQTLEEVAQGLRWGQRWQVWYQSNFQSEIENQVARNDRVSEAQDLIVQKVTELLLAPTVRKTFSEDGQQVTIVPHKDWGPKLIPELLKTHVQLEQLHQQQTRPTQIEEAVLTLCELGIYGSETRSNVHKSITAMRENLRAIVDKRGGSPAVEQTIEVDSQQVL